MAIKYKAKPKLSFVFGTTIGVTICVLMWIVLSAIMTSFVLNETIAVQSLEWMTQLMNGIIAFVGLLICGAVVNEKKLVSCIICSVAYILIMICFSLLFSDGLFKGFWFGILSISIGSAMAIIINMRKREEHRSKIYRKRFR